MRIVFLPGGYLNQRGPFEAGQVIDVPNDHADQLIATGMATPVDPPSGRPITVTLKLREFEHAVV